MAIQQQGGFGFRGQSGGIRPAERRVPGAGNNFLQGLQGNQGSGQGGPFSMLLQRFGGQGQGGGNNSLLNRARGIFGTQGQGQGQGGGLAGLFRQMQGGQGQRGPFGGIFGGGAFRGQGQGVTRNPILDRFGQQLAGGGPGQFFGGGGGGQGQSGFGGLGGPIFRPSVSYAPGGPQRPNDGFAIDPNTGLVGPDPNFQGGGGPVQGPAPISENFGIGGFQPQGGFGGSLIQQQQPLARPRRAF